MWLDENLEFADATSVGVPNASTVNVGDDVDTGTAVRDLGTGEPLYLVIQVVSAITSAGAATVRFRLSSDAASPLGVDGTQTKHVVSETFPVATLVAGFSLAIALPSEFPVYERFLGFQVEAVAAFALNGGTVNAFLTPTPAKYRAYADAVN